MGHIIDRCITPAAFSFSTKMLLPLSSHPPPLIHTQVLLESDCPVCSETDLECRIRDVLYQKDWGGDYECGSEGATFQ